MFLFTKSLHPQLPLFLPLPHPHHLVWHLQISNPPKQGEQVTVLLYPCVFVCGCLTNSVTDGTCITLFLFAHRMPVKIQAFTFGAKCFFFFAKVHFKCLHSHPCHLSLPHLSPKKYFPISHLLIREKVNLNSVKFDFNFHLKAEFNGPFDI